MSLKISFTNEDIRYTRELDSPVTISWSSPGPIVAEFPTESYTPPVYSGVNFNFPPDPNDYVIFDWSEDKDYTVPVYNELNFEFGTGKAPPYSSPIGNQVGLDFFGAYTPPLGNQVGLEFAPLRDILGNSESTIDLLVTSTGQIKNGDLIFCKDWTGSGDLIFGETCEPDSLSGSSSIVVDLLTTGTAETETGLIFGNSSILVDITTEGDAENKILGNANTPVSISTTGIAVHDIEANSNIIVDLQATGTGVRQIEGDSNVTVDLLVSGYAAHDIFGDSSIKVELIATGHGVREIFGNSDIPIFLNTSGEGAREIFGDSNITVGLDATGSGGREIFGNSNIKVDLIAQGTGQKSLIGSSNVTMSISETTGSGVWTNGNEMFGNADNLISVKSESEGSVYFILPSAGSSRPVPMTISTSGTAETSIFYVPIEGNSSTEVSIFTKTDDKDSTGKTALINRMEWDWSRVSFSVYAVLDIDNNVYEIRSVTTNKDYLKDFRREMWFDQIEIGSYMKEDNELIENFFDGTYTVERYTTLRKYGGSELLLNINISDRYKYIKNKKNIIESINREVDRALIDTFALYELEFE